MFVVAQWKPLHNEEQRCGHLKKTAITLGTGHVTTAGTHGCNCLVENWASAPRRTTIAAYHMNAHYNYKSDSIDESKNIHN